MNRCCWRGTAPIIVSRDRAAGAAFAQSAGATVIVMDDGLQNPSLHKDVSIAVVDGGRGLGNGLRVPRRAASRADRDATGSCPGHPVVGTDIGAEPWRSLRVGAACRSCAHGSYPRADAVKAIGRRKVLAFAGIGDPRKFFATLALAGIRTKIEESFADHHAYTDDEAQRILARCEGEKLVPVTTEKDIARLTAPAAPAHGSPEPLCDSGDRSSPTTPVCF